MPRFKVSVQTTEVYFIDTTSESRAAIEAITLSSAGARPCYRLDAVADAEFYSEPFVSVDDEMHRGCF